MIRQKRDMITAKNDRVWFEAHKNDYRVFLLEPAQAFVLTLGAPLQMLSNGIRCDTRTDGRGVLMRLHWDTRLSPDKSPYHTHLSGLFWEGSQKKTERPAFGCADRGNRNGTDDRNLHLSTSHAYGLPGGGER